MLLDNNSRVNSSATDDITPLHFAAQNGHVAICKALLKCRAKVNARGTKRADTPLHLASFKGHADVVEYLLKKNADPSLKNKMQKTALDVASTPEVRAVLAAAKPSEAEPSAAASSMSSAALADEAAPDEANPPAPVTGKRRADDEPEEQDQDQEAIGPAIGPPARPPSKVAKQEE